MYLLMRCERLPVLLFFNSKLSLCNDAYIMSFLGVVHVVCKTGNSTSKHGTVQSKLLNFNVCCCYAIYFSVLLLLYIIGYKWLLIVYFQCEFC